MSQNWQNNYFLILFAAAIIHGLYLAFIVFARSEKGSGRSWLALALVGISALLANYFIYISGAIYQYPHLLNVFDPLTFVTGPAFYFFIRKSADKTFLFKWPALLHVLPVVWAIWESAAIFQWPAETKLAAINTIFEGHTPSFVEMLLANRFNLITILYAIASLWYLSSGKVNSAVKHLAKVNWLRKFSIIFLSLLVFATLLPIVFMLMSLDGASMELTLTLMFAVSIHVLGYAILKHEKGTPWVAVAGKYQTSPLNESSLSGYKVRILSHLEQERPWLNPGFSIGDLSTQLSIPKHHLSQVLSEEMNMSFVDLVNSYRVEAAKVKLTPEVLEKYSVMGIAMDCGFASKSTFNRTFKKFTGMTPTAYLAEENMPSSPVKSAG